MIDEGHLERHEAKFIIRPAQAQAIRDFIRPFTRPDPFARGSPSEYTVTSLYLDTPDLEFYQASREDLPVRFKLRVRTYNQGERASPVFVEIKRKVNGIVIKSRAAIPPGRWGEKICRSPDLSLPFRSPGEERAYLEFIGLAAAWGARPAMLVRYQRECYYPSVDDYVRVTFDRRLTYLPARGYEWPSPAARWRAMDSARILERPFSGLILELKSFNSVPVWMVDLTKRFDLTRVGFCKYAAAMAADEIFFRPVNIPGMIEDALI